MVSQERRKVTICSHLVVTFQSDYNECLLNEHQMGEYQTKIQKGEESPVTLCKGRSPHKEVELTLG